MIVDGKLVASSIKEKIIKKIQEQGNKKVCFVIFGNDPGSKQYIAMKKRFAESLGIVADVYEYSDDLSGDEIKQNVSNIVSMGYHGVVLQLPLPKSVDPQEVLNLIPSEMDVDVLSDDAKQKYIQGENKKVPPVARAVSEILDFYNIGLENKKILIVGNGKLVGEPVGNMLTLKNLEFSRIDKNTPEDVQKDFILNADIIVSGAGSPHFIKLDMVKNGVVLIDAGTSEQNGKLVGDIDPNCSNKAVLLTPVPNGVGPVTMACLFLNILM